MLSNNTTAEESYRNGKSAFAWTSSPASANILYNDLKKIPGADKWDTRFYSMYSKLQKTYGYLNCAVAVSATSKNKEAALTVLDAIYADKDMHNLILFGFEGKHYELNENGEYIPKSENYVAPNLGLKNEAYEFEVQYDYPYALDLVEEMNSIAVSDPLVNCAINSEGEMASLAVQLNDVFTEYSSPRMYGAVPDVKAAIKKEKEALKIAGIDKYLKHVQVQMDEYVKTHQEAEAEFKKSRQKVLDYKKKNPNKVNPKDYK